MSKMKSLYAMAIMLSAMTALRHESETEEERAERIRLFEIENKKRKGLKLFNIEGKEVWAINEKNAIKKAKKS